MRISSAEYLSAGGITSDFVGWTSHQHVSGLGFGEFSVLGL